MFCIKDAETKRESLEVIVRRKREAQVETDCVDGRNKKTYLWKHKGGQERCRGIQKEKKTGDTVRDEENDANK